MVCKNDMFSVACIRFVCNSGMSKWYVKAVLKRYVKVVCQACKLCLYCVQSVGRPPGAEALVRAAGGGGGDSSRAAAPDGSRLPAHAAGDSRPGGAEGTREADQDRPPGGAEEEERGRETKAETGKRTGNRNDIEKQR